MLARAVAGFADAAVVIVRLVLVIAVSKPRFVADVVKVRGSIGRVGWLKVMVGVRRMRRSCQRDLRGPWRPEGF